MPTRRALPLLLLVVVLPLRAQAAEVLESATPDFGNVSVSYTGAALTLTFGANVLASLPLGVGRTALTLLADPVDLPQARTHPHRRIVASWLNFQRVYAPRACSLTVRGAGRTQGDDFRPRGD